MKRHIHHVIGALFLGVLLTIVAAPVTAGKVTITGSTAAVFDQATGSFIFTGPVTITDGETTIKGEYVSYHGETETLQFRGPVSIEQNGSTLKGNDLRYDMKKSEGAISQATGTFTPNGATSPVHLFGEKVTTCKERTVLEGARVTTCDPANPGYYLSSRTIEIYPGEKIVLYGVRFIESGLTLFYWPRVTFSLKQTDPYEAADAVILPKIGYSTEEGWYVKTAYGYRGPGQQRGRIMLDYMQLLGWGYGVLHTFRSDAAVKEQFYAYAQPNRDTDHTDVQLSFDEQRTLLGNIKFTGRSAYETSYTTGEQVEYENTLSLSQSREGGSTSINYSDVRLSGPISGYEIDGSAHHNQDLGGGWKLNLNATIDKRERTDYILDRNLVGYVAELRRDSADWSLGMVAEDKFNPELDDDEEDDKDDEKPVITWNRAQRLPELTLRINRLSLVGWDTPFELDAAWGRLTENSYFGDIKHKGTQRTHLAARVKPLRLSLGRLGSLQWRGAATRRLYSTGEDQWVLGAQSDYRVQMTKALSLTGNYRYEQAFGDLSPFYFDRITDQEEVEARLDYNTAAAQLSLTGGYDLLAAEPLDIVGSVRLQPMKSLRLQAQGAYSPVDASWLYVVGTSQFTPNERFTLNLGAKYDVQRQRTDRVDAVLQWDLGGWEVAYAGIYDGINKEFDEGQFRITRDLDCRAIDLRYSPLKKEVWLEYRITAFPNASVKLGANSDDLMFDAKGWEEVIATATE